MKFVIHFKRYSKEEIQTGVEQVHSWYVQMGMPLSVDKCLVIHGRSSNPKHQYECGSAILPEVDKVADSGIMLSADNTFHDHIASTAKKGRRLVGLCCSSIRCILPVLLYASSTRSPYICQETDELEAIHRSFKKRLSGQRKCSYGKRLRNLSLLSLERGVWNLTYLQVDS